MNPLTIDISMRTFGVNQIITATHNDGGDDFPLVLCVMIPLSTRTHL